MSDGTDILAALTREIERFIEPLTMARLDPKARANIFNALGWDLAQLTGFPTQRLSTDVEAISNAIAGAAAVRRQGSS